MKYDWSIFKMWAMYNKSGGFGPTWRFFPFTPGLPSGHQLNERRS